MRASQASVLGSATRGPPSRSRSPRRSGTAAPTASNLDFEPIVAGYADEFTALVRTVRRELNNDRAGLPADVRRDGLDRQPADRRRHGPRRRRRRLHHGLRLPDRWLADRRLDLTAVRPRSTTCTDTVKAYTARIPASKMILGVPYYGRAWSTASSAAPREDAVAVEVRRRRRALLRRRRWPRERRTAGATTPSSSRRGRPTASRRAPRPTAASPRWRRAVLRRRGVAEAALRPRQSRRTCAAPGSGRSATTTAAPSSGRPSPTSSSPTGRRPSWASGTLAPTQRDEGFRVRWKPV